MEWDYRRPTIFDLHTYPILNELIHNHYDPRILELNIQQEAPDAVAEIMVNYTAIFNGTATAAVVYYDAADVGDAAAGVGLRTIKILSINEDGDDYQENTDALAGQTGTATTEKHQRLIAVKGMTAGANGDAEGAVYVQDDAAGTNKHMTIAAADISSISARLYLPDDWEGLMYYIKASKPEVSTAATAIIADTGFIFQPIWEENLSLLSDDTRTYAVSSSRPAVELYNATPIIASNGGANYISLQHVTIEDDLNSLALYKIIYIMWGTTAAHRGLP